jgi:hypothetical protein
MEFSLGILCGRTMGGTGLGFNPDGEGGLAAKP